MIEFEFDDSDNDAIDLYLEWADSTFVVEIEYTNEIESSLNSLSPFARLSPLYGRGGDSVYYQMPDGRVAEWHSDGGIFRLSSAAIEPAAITEKMKEFAHLA